MLRGGVALVVLALALACGGGPECPEGGLRLVYDVDGGDPSQVREVLQQRLNAVSECSEARVEGEQVVVDLVGELDPQVKPLLRGSGQLTIRAAGDEGGITDPVVADARVVDDAGGLRVLVTLAEPSASAFSELTAANVGKKLIIALDGEVLVDATVMEALDGGAFSIDPGSAHADPVGWTRRVAALLEAGALPSPITLASESTFP